MGPHRCGLYNWVDIVLCEPSASGFMLRKAVSQESTMVHSSHQTRCLLIECKFEFGIRALADRIRI
jgi:hypothetical protein